MNSVARIIRGSALCASLLVSACSTYVPPGGNPDAFLPMNRFPIAVEAQMATFRLPLDARGGLSAPGESQLQQIVADYLQNGSGSITVAVSGNDRNATARITDLLAALGVQPSRIAIATDNGPAAAAVAIVNFVRYHADPPACGHWSEDLGITWQNKPSPNFGCATQHNLAVMVADPHDLVAPKTVEAGDAQRSLTVLDKYRRGEPTVSTKAEEQSGAVAAVTTGGKQ